MRGRGRDRKRNQLTDPGPPREARRPRRSSEKEIDYDGMIHLMETEAYHGVLEAFSAQSDSVSWERVALMTKLRKELNITDDEHGEMLVKIRKSDEPIRALREWRNSTATATATATAQEFGNVDRRYDVIQIGDTDQIIHKVEELLESQETLSLVKLEEAKLVLRGHERAILEALDQLAVDEAAGA